MVMPAPTGSFPAPTGMFPPTQAQLQPATFGVSPYSPQNLYVPKLFDPNASAQSIAARAQSQGALFQQAQAAAASQVTGVDVTGASSWSPGEAAAQTDNALAKLSTVNPELAQRLAAERTPGQDSGQGFLGSIMHVAGEILHPALSVGGKILDIVSRTANIIPNIAYDAVDGGDSNILGDIGSALSGDVRHNWHSVLTKMGVPDSGPLNWLATVAGFAGDIATDPLTWLIPVGGGAKLGEAAAAVGEKLAINPEIVARAAETNLWGVGKAGQDGAQKVLVDHLRAALGHVDVQGVRAAGGNAEELASRLAGVEKGVYDDAQQKVMHDLFGLYSTGYNMQATRTLGTFLRKGGQIALEDGQFMGAEQAKGLLEQAVRDGAMHTAKSSEWLQARAVSSAVGGLRFKAQLPFTALRYISPALPKTAGMSIENAARFFAGQSGMTRLVGAIANGTEGASFDDLTRWMQGGFEAAKDANPELMGALRGRGANLASSYYHLSEQVGGLTAHFGQAGAAARHGLIGYLGYQEEKRAADAGAGFLERVSGVVGSAEGKPQLLEDMKTLGIDANAKKSTAKVEDTLRYARFLHYFPQEADTSTADTIAAWFRDRSVFNESKLREKVARGEKLTPAETDAVKRSDNILADMQEVAAQTSQGEQQILRRYATSEDLAREQAAVYEVNVGNVKMRLGDATVLHPDQVPAWQAGAVHEGVTDQKWYVHPETTEAKQRLQSNGVDSTLRSYGNQDYGVKVLDHRTSPDDVEVAIKGSYTPLDANGDAMLAGPEHTVQAEFDRAKEAVDAASVVSGQLPADKLAYDRNVAESATAAYQAYTPDSGFVRTLEDGSKEATVFRPEDVMQVSKDAGQVHASQGYFHFTYNDESLRYMRGQLKGGRDKKILLHAPNIQAELSRRTRGLTLDEANKVARDYLISTIDDPRVDLAKLPEWVLESNPLTAHMDYVTKMAEGIESKMLGRAARRFSLLGDLGPHMFGGALPRRQEFEWALSPGMAGAVSKLDAQSQAAVQRLLRSNKMLLDAQHAAHAETADQMGLLLTTSEALDAAGEVATPDRLSQLIVKHRTLVGRVQGRIDEARQVVIDRQEQLAAEQDEYNRLRTRGAQAMAGKGEVLPPPTPEELAAAGWPVDPAEMPVEKTPLGVRVRGYHSAAPVIQKETDAAGEVLKPVKYVKDAEGNVVTKQVGVPFERKTPLRNSGFHFGPENASASRVSSNLGGVPDEATRAAAAKDTFPVEFEGRVPLNKKGEPLYLSEDQAHNLGAAAQGRLKGVGFKFDKDGNIIASRPFGKLSGEELSPAQEEMVAAEERAWKDSGGEVWTSKDIRDRYDGALYNNQVEGASKLNNAPSTIVFDPSLNRTVKSLRQDGTAAFDDAADSGNIFYNSKTDSVLTREGALVKKGGGRQLRGPGQIANERTKLTDTLDQLEKDQKVLDSSPEAQVLSGSKEAHRVARTAEQASKTRASEKAAAKHVGEVIGRLQMRVSNDMAEANRTLAEAKGLRAKLQPAFHAVETKGDLQNLTALHIPGLEGYAMPPFMAEQWHALYDLHGPSYLTAQWRKTVIGPWKRWATFRNPGFHVRNFFGAWFNSWLMGTTHDHYEFSRLVNMARWGHGDYYNTAVKDAWFDNLHLGRIFGDSNKGTTTYGQVSEFLANHGIGRANTQSVMGSRDAIDLASNVADDIRAHGGSGSVLRRAGRKYDNAMRSVGSGVEDFHRTAAWAAGMATNEGDPYAARTLTMLAHGDYADLSQQEDHIRDLIPFYKWMRTNVPYQIRSLAENPAQTTLIAKKLKASAYDLAGVDQNEAEAGQLDWMKQTLTLPIPKWMPFIGSKDGPDGLKFATLDLPYNDLYNGLNDYMSSFLPVARNVIESYGLKEAVFSGKPLTGRMEPLSGVFNIPGVRDVLSAAGLASKGADGQLYVDDKMQNVMMAFPLYARFRNFLEADPTRVENRVGSFTSMVSGIGVRQQDATSAELDFYYNDVEPVLQAYRDMGIQFPSVDDFKAASSQVVSPAAVPDVNAAADASGVLAAPAAQAA